MGIVTEKDDVDIRTKMAYGMFDTSGKVRRPHRVRLFELVAGVAGGAHCTPGHLLGYDLFCRMQGAAAEIAISVPLGIYVLVFRRAFAGLHPS